MTVSVCLSVFVFVRGQGCVTAAVCLIIGKNT